MLLSEHAIVRLEAGRARPDRLTRKTHGHYLDYARRMLELYRGGVGRSRRELHLEVERVLADEPDCDPRRIKAFCKLLDEASVFNQDRGGQAARLRLRVFALAAARHPLVERRDGMFDREEMEVKAELAAELGRPWPELEAALFADLIDEHRLLEFKGYPDPAALLSRYNVAQVQACLYAATSLTVDLTRDFKTILRHAKLSRLLHDITRLGPSHYRVVFSGPASILRDTRRYGVAMARFLPALLACSGWRMAATIDTRFGRTARLELSPDDGLQSHLEPPEDYDSALEQKFADRFGEKRDGWTLVREGEIVHSGQRVFVPDFVFRHDDQTQVLFEIAGFWTPQYLASRLDTLRHFDRHLIVIAAPAESAATLAPAARRLITYKTAINLKALLEVLEEIRGMKEVGSR